MLAQFLEDAFTAAQKSGAAAILPYEFVPHAYAYNASLYAFGTDSAAYTSSVAAMYQYQAQRVSSKFGCPAWRLAQKVPHEHVTALHPQRATTFGQPPSAVDVACGWHSHPNPLLQTLQAMHDGLACRGGCTRGVRPTCRHAPGAAETVNFSIPAWGNRPSALAVLESHGRCRAVGVWRAQTLACSSGACPVPAPPCQCYDVPPNSNYAKGDFYAHTCGQLVNLLVYPPSPGFCDITYGRCTPCPGYDYCAFCTNICCGTYDGYYDGCLQLARPLACIRHEQPHVTCCSAAPSLSRRSSHVPAEGQRSHVPAGGAHDTRPAAAWRRLGGLSWGARTSGPYVHPRPVLSPGLAGRAGNHLREGVPLRRGGHVRLLLRTLHALRRRDAAAVSDLPAVHRATIQRVRLGDRLGGAALEGGHLKTGPCARLVRRVDDVDVRLVARSSMLVFFAVVVAPACAIDFFLD